MSLYVTYCPTLHSCIIIEQCMLIVKTDAWICIKVEFIVMLVFCNLIVLPPLFMSHTQNEYYGCCLNSSCVLMILMFDMFLYMYLIPDSICIMKIFHSSAPEEIVAVFILQKKLFCFLSYVSIFLMHIGLIFICSVLFSTYSMT